ncbi:hypothetical protein F442_01025 [Phytophthora nicotianae P10297]|uniref:Uncharacterized protein n=4 Tax=Phytophthora nicotianae TaxID=4792 RepID=W2RHJ6_PHYN3|nr:hypothetical protein PPTG_00917 [Phytophthora nicotianae INRA-310]ETM02590.1 hypothetical protein L917_00970 [Phytophthora nicotianae]ETN24696.1 hypothetical protein PPTG_00917 [Phytophthora nicotianae INRA-310]ETO85060.1 hypothetical protein F444_01086 [Phytophthora nicotianae P1976]ETP54164.1 hypothetical protein F442_01025 [Phytophthora nicotianae P10297]
MYPRLTTVFRKTPGGSNKEEQIKRPNAASKSAEKRSPTKLDRRLSVLVKCKRPTDAAEYHSDDDLKEQEAPTIKQTVHSSVLTERLVVVEGLNGHHELRYEAVHITKYKTSSKVKNGLAPRRGIVCDEAIAKSHVEAAQKREVMRTTRDKLLSKHKLLSAGAPKDDVHRAIQE